MPKAKNDNPLYSIFKTSVILLGIALLLIFYSKFTIEHITEEARANIAKEFLDNEAIAGALLKVKEKEIQEAVKGYKKGIKYKTRYTILSSSPSPPENLIFSYDDNFVHFVRIKKEYITIDFNSADTLSSGAYYGYLAFNNHRVHKDWHDLSKPGCKNVSDELQSFLYYYSSDPTSAETNIAIF